MLPLVSSPSPRGAGPSLDAAIAHALGRNVRTARLAAGLTQEDLADRSGVGIASVQRIEQGHANPSLATLFALARGSTCDVLDLIPRGPGTAQTGDAP
jgi:transcriptional regulator with XRE-family HTH domain